MRKLGGMAVIAASCLLAACGSRSGSGAPEGALQLNLNGNGTTPMAEIVVRNVFDTGFVHLVQCIEKDHTLEGQTFCDELMILPPGVYELIVQSHNGCYTEFDHYKVVVKPGETVEVTINMICGDANGGLDVIVLENWKPIFTDITFEFPDGDKANKYICIDGEDVTVTIAVEDPDTACEDLTPTWYVNGSATLLPLITATASSEVDGVCYFSATIDSSASATPASYNVTLKVADNGFVSSFTFPIHLIECEPEE